MVMAKTTEKETERRIRRWRLARPWSPSEATLIRLGVTTWWMSLDAAARTSKP